MRSLHKKRTSKNHIIKHQTVSHKQFQFNVGNYLKQPEKRLSLLVDRVGNVVEIGEEERAVVEEEKLIDVEKDHSIS